MAAQHSRAHSALLLRLQVQLLHRLLLQLVQRESRERWQHGAAQVLLLLLQLPQHASLQRLQLSNWCQQSRQVPAGKSCCERETMQSLRLLGPLQALLSSYWRQRAQMHSQLAVDPQRYRTCH